MRITTWNINSVRARLHRLPDYLDSRRPDVLCLQEIKCLEKDFPREIFESRGYHLAIHGQKTYNGVAGASLHPIEAICTDLQLPVASEARAIGVTIRGIRILNIYAVNGRRVGHEQYTHKLAWFDALRARLGAANDPAQPLVLCGDFNIAPAAADIHDPAAWHEKNICSSLERQRLQALEEWGLVDAWRHLHPDRGGRLAYSWWDYRGAGFERDRGLRIDLHLITRGLLARLKACEIDRYARMGEKPSDHAPVTLVLRDPAG